MNITKAESHVIYSLWTVMRLRSMQHKLMSRLIIAVVSGRRPTPYQQLKHCNPTPSVLCSWLLDIHSSSKQYKSLISTSILEFPQEKKKMSSSTMTWSTRVLHCSIHWKGKSATKFTFSTPIPPPLCHPSTISTLSLLTLLTCRKALRCWHGNTGYCAEQVHIYCISTLCLCHHPALCAEMFQ